MEVINQNIAQEQVGANDILCFIICGGGCIAGLSTGMVAYGVAAMLLF